MHLHSRQFVVIRVIRVKIISCQFDIISTISINSIRVIRA
jgi:hypothetical protein